MYEQTNVTFGYAQEVVLNGQGQPVLKMTFLLEPF